jgi:hypothetical protein
MAVKGETDMSLTNYPECCYCGGVAKGRCVFMGNDNEVVDNPFCPHHETVVYHQTNLSIQVLHAAGLERELIAVQKWVLYSTPPSLPVNKAEFVKIATQQLQSC